MSRGRVKGGLPNRVKGDSLGTLYRTLVQESEYGRRKNVRSERLKLIEQLGYIHRRRRTESVGGAGLGVFARARTVPPRRASADVVKEAVDRREARRRLQSLAECKSCRVVLALPRTLRGSRE